MGEWMIQVPVKLEPHTVEQLDLLRGAYPFKPGRSTVIRELVEEGLRLISEGILQFRAQAVNRVPSVQSGQSVPGIPDEVFPNANKKPPVRVNSLPRRLNGGREINGVSRRMAVVADLLASQCPPFLGKVRPFKSTPYQRVA